MKAYHLIMLSLLTCSAYLCSACALSRSATPQPLYDFENVFLNDDMTGQKPWRVPDRAAIRLALAPRAATGSKSAPTASGVVTQPPVAQALPKAAADASTAAIRPKVTHRKSLNGKAEPLLHVDVPDVSIEGDERPPAPQRMKGTVLGDGSVSGELVAAAIRMVGLGPAMSPAAFLDHLAKTTAVTIFGSEGRAGVAGAWDALTSRGLTFAQGERSVKPGDLVFFDDVADVDGDGAPDDLSGVGVVEAVQDGTLVCIVPALGAVRRVPASPDKPSVRRLSGQVLNAPIRPRRYAAREAGPGLSGQLVAGFARL